MSEDVISTLSVQQSSDYVSQSSSMSERSRTHDPLYYQTVLYQNHIEIINPRRSREPPSITGHLSKIRTPHPSPNLSQAFVNEFVTGLYDLQNDADQTALSEFITNLLPSTSLSLSRWLDYTNGEGGLCAYLSSTAGLAHISQSFLCRHMVPPDVVTPRLGQVYRYSYQTQDAAFTDAQLKTQLRLKDNVGNTLSIANNEGLRFPFFVIELEGEGKNWVSANKIGGGCFACLRSVQAINRALEESRQKSSTPSSPRQHHTGGWQHPPQELGVDNLVYGLTADNNIARLYVAWYLEDSGGGISGCKLFQVEEFVLTRVQELQSLWVRIRHILDWGKERRLAQIRQALDHLESDDFSLKYDN
ncbi:hypothetical protein GGR58DRAFT_524568 [Xylaria digitata]|nr:hypothetical protein GGR58DRAFT_524568 [Xylaria digitata]